MSTEQRKFEIMHMLLYIQLYITRQAWPNQNCSNRCNLTLNQRTEIVSKCRHKAKQTKKSPPNETTFNANRLITVMLFQYSPFSTCSYLESNLYLCCASLQGYFFTKTRIFTFMRCCEQQEISACCVAKLHLICI